MDVGPGHSALAAQESHERAVRRRRALIVGLFALFGVVANVPTMGGLGSSQALVNVLLPVPVALAAVSLWRRERLGDRGFLAVVLTMIVALTPDLLVTTPAGSLRSAELVLLGPLVVAATFCGSRWHVALVMVAAVGGCEPDQPAPARRPAGRRVRDHR